MISAIIYSSTTGSCKQYAEKLSAALHIPAFDAKKVYTPKGREVIYVGWLFAGKVVGLEKALQGRFSPMNFCSKAMAEEELARLKK